MTYEYERVEMHEADIDAAMRDRGAAGWRLVAAVVHPYTTSDASPVFVTFWKRAIA